MYCPSALFFLRGIRRAAPAQVTACRVVTFAHCERSAREVSSARGASTRHAASSTLLVVGASGLCTPGPVRPDGVHRLPALFLLRGIRRAAPAQVTACRVVTVSLKKCLKLHFSLRLTVSHTYVTVLNINLLKCITLTGLTGLLSSGI